MLKGRCVQQEMNVEKMAAVSLMVPHPLLRPGNRFLRHGKGCGIQFPNSQAPKKLLLAGVRRSLNAILRRSVGMMGTMGTGTAAAAERPTRCPARGMAHEVAGFAATIIDALPQRVQQQAVTI